MTQPCKYLTLNILHFFIMCHLIFTTQLINLLQYIAGIKGADTFAVVPEAPVHNVKC
jgi:hypothetical protein